MVSNTEEYIVYILIIFQGIKTNSALIHRQYYIFLSDP